MAPPKAVEKKKRKIRTRYSQELLTQALNDIRDKKMSVRKVCRHYGIPRSTLQDRIAGRTTDMLKKPGPDPILSHDGEKEIVDWLVNLAKCGFPIKKAELLDTVQKIIKDTGKPNNFKDDRPGQTWFMNFLKRHPQISQRTAEGINKARARVTEESIRLWFRELIEFLTESNNLDILESPERIFNGDESGFAFCPKTGKVLGPRGYRNLYEIKNGSKDNITVLVTFNAIAQLCPPLVVFPYVRPPKQVVDSMPPDWVLGKSESGWMRGDVFFEYITNDFNNWLENNGIKKPILLLVDGHKSHMSMVLSAMCEQMGIILYALPPNTTHMLQPADVSVFGPLKAHWKNIVRNFLSKPENINSAVTKTNFCALFRETLESSNLQQNIKNGFRRCGLYPFDPDAVDYSKCVLNTLENLTRPQLGPEITNADLVSTRKVLKHLKQTLAARNINVAVIMKEMKKLKKKTPQNDDVLYETCSEDRTNSTINDMSASLLVEEDKTKSDLDQDTTTRQTDITHISEDSPNELVFNLLPTDEFFKVPETPTVVNNTELNIFPPSSLIEDLCTTTTSSLLTEKCSDSISSLHLSGSYLEVGSVVSLDDILILPLQMSTPTTAPSQITVPVLTSETAETVEQQSQFFSKTQCSPQSKLTSVLHTSIPRPRETSGKSIEVREHREAFKKHLYIPNPPSKSKMTSVRTPSAISSVAWRKFYEDKEKIKKEKIEVSKKRQENLKMKRQEKDRLTQRKASRRNALKPLKPNKENEKIKVKCALCEDILISDTEEDTEKNIGCDYCTQWYHLRCTDFVGLKYEDVQDKPFKCNACFADI